MDDLDKQFEKRLDFLFNSKELSQFKIYDINYLIDREGNRVYFDHAHFGKKLIKPFPLEIEDWKLEAMDRMFVYFYDELKEYKGDIYWFERPNFGKHNDCYDMRAQFLFMKPEDRT